MKKFSLLKEEIESQNAYLCEVTSTFAITARSESEASAKLKVIIDKFKETNNELKDYYVVGIENSVLSEKLTPSSAIMNTQKMMSDYLNNNGANKMDIHYQNLERMLKVFQSTTVNQMYQSPSTSMNESINVGEFNDSIKSCERMMEDWIAKKGKKSDSHYKSLENIHSMLSKAVKKEKKLVKESAESDIDPNDVDASIKEVEELIKSYTKNGGKEDSQQLANYDDMLEMLKDIKKKL